MNSNSHKVKKTLESDLSGPRKPGFSPVSCCLSHDVSKSPRFLLNFPGRANGSDLAQRARYAGKTSTSSASITSRRDTLQACCSEAEIPLAGLQGEFILAFSYTLNPKL
jgi:hypothetical protein